MSITFPPQSSNALSTDRDSPHFAGGPSAFGRLVAVDQDDHSCIFRVAAKDQFDYQTSAHWFLGRVGARLLDESGQAVGVCVDCDADDTEQTVDLTFEVTDTNARAKLSSGTLHGISIPVVRVGYKPKTSGLWTLKTSGSARLTDRATRTEPVEGGKLFKLVRAGRVEKIAFRPPGGNGIASDSLSVFKGILRHPPDRLEPDVLAKAARRSSLALDRTALEIRKVHDTGGNALLTPVLPQTQGADRDEDEDEHRDEDASVAAIRRDLARKGSNGHEGRVVGGPKPRGRR